MKNTKTLFTALIPLLFFTSCQKMYSDEFATTTPANPSVQLSNRPKTYSEDITYSSGGRDSVTFNLTYDANGRVLSLISASSPGDKFIYQYQGTTITVDIYNSGIINIHENLYLNPNNFVDSTFQYNDTKDTTSEKYLYNVGKQLVSVKSYTYKKSAGIFLDDVTNYTYDASGNVIKDASTYDVNTYDYTTLTTSTSLGFDYLPAAKYLVKTSTNVNGGVIVKFDHTYTFISNNRLSSEKIVSSDGDIIIKKYTY